MWFQTAPLNAEMRTPLLIIQASISSIISPCQEGTAYNIQLLVHEGSCTRTTFYNLKSKGAAFYVFKMTGKSTGANKFSNTKIKERANTVSVHY